MSNFRKKNYVFGYVGFCSLIIGLFIYLIFRENTYVAKFVSTQINLDFLRDLFLPLENDFIKYYLVDYLWGLSLNCGLHIIFFPNMKKSVVLTIVTFIFGTVYEGLQKFDIISGTGDIADIILYLLAGLTVNLINFILIKKEEKTK